MKARGAAGVISTQIAAYTRPETTPEVLQWGSIPFDPENVSFGFKATPRAARRLRERLAAGAVRVHVRADTVFHRRPVRTLVAEIPGTRWPDERVVLVAHVQEPGANDNASGCGTLLAAALGDASRHRRRRHPGAGQDHHLDLGRRDPRQQRLDRRRCAARDRACWP